MVDDIPYGDSLTYHMVGEYVATAVSCVLNGLVNSPISYILGEDTLHVN